MASSHARRETLRVNGYPDFTTSIFRLGRSGAQPRVVLTAGLHGDEWYGTAVLLELWNELKDREINGSITMVPAANLPALLDRERESRRYPGDLNRSFMKRNTPLQSGLRNLADQLWATCVENADYLIDIHSGGLHDVIPHGRTEGNIDRALGLTKALGLEYLLVWNSFPKGLLVSKALRKGLPALALEQGSGHELREAKLIELKQRLYLLFQRLGLIRHSSSVPPVAPMIVTAWAMLAPPASGLFIPSCSLATSINLGATFGFLRPFTGSENRRLQAPCAGRVLALHNPGPVRQGTNYLVSILED